VIKKLLGEEIGIVLSEKGLSVASGGDISGHIIILTSNPYPVLSPTILGERVRVRGSGLLILF